MTPGPTSQARPGRHGPWRQFRPDYFVDSIYEINPEWLAERQIEALIIDVDNTILPRDAHKPDRRLLAWVEELLGGGLRLSIISNNWTARVRGIAKELNLGLVAPAAKPLRPAFLRSLKSLGTSKERTAIVGDQVFTDVLGGNRAGLTTILVPPISQIDLVHTRLLRVFEKMLLRRLAKRVLVDGKWQEAN